MLRFASFEADTEAVTWFSGEWIFGRHRSRAFGKTDQAPIQCFNVSFFYTNFPSLCVERYITHFVTTYMNKSLANGSANGMCGWDERMDATQLSVFHFVSNRACRKRSSSSSSAHHLSKRARDCMIFMLHDLTKTKTSLGARVFRGP